MREGEPSLMLEARLQAGLDLYRATRPRIVVVTGKGESAVMARWLLERGVDPADIVEEPWATSTNENLERSRALLPDAERLTVVTNGFHVGRTRIWALHLGIPIEVVAAPTPRRSRVKNYAREIIALPHSAARVAWRRLLHWLDR